MDKKSLRRQYLLKRSEMVGPTRLQADSMIVKTVLSLPEFQMCRIVAGYATDGTEPDVLPLLEKALENGKLACLPKWNGTEYIMSLVTKEDLTRLVPGKYGLSEPAEIKVSGERMKAPGALYLVPGVAFDQNFNRLGRGGGIYDRMLSGKGSAIALGIFYECQYCSDLPDERHDVSLDVIVTESKIRRAELQRRNIRSATGTETRS